MVKAYVVDISDTLKAHQNGKDPPLQEAGNCQRFERFYLFIVRSIYQVYDKYIYIFFFSAELSLTHKELSLVTYEWKTPSFCIIVTIAPTKKKRV